VDCGSDKEDMILEWCGSFDIRNKMGLQKVQDRKHGGSKRTRDWKNSRGKWRTKLFTGVENAGRLYRKMAKWRVNV